MLAITMHPRDFTVVGDTFFSLNRIKDGKISVGIYAPPDRKIYRMDLVKQEVLEFNGWQYIGTQGDKMMYKNANTGEIKDISEAIKYQLLNGNIKQV